MERFGVTVQFPVTGVGQLDCLRFYHNGMSFGGILAKSKEYYNLLIQRKVVLLKGAKRFQEF